MSSEMPQYSELHGSPVENRDGARWTAERRLLVEWDLRHDLMNHILGTSYKDEDRWEYCRAKTVRSEPYEPSGQEQRGEDDIAAYELALVTVGYSTAGQPEEQGENVGSGGEDLYVSEEIEPTVEFLTLDYTNYRWGAPDGALLRENEAPGRLIPGLTYTRTHYNIENVPAAVFDFVGYTNQNALQMVTAGVSTRIFGAETLLYVPQRLRRTYTDDGDPRWTVPLSFMWKPQGWNVFWRPKKAGGDGGYDNIYVYDGNEYLPYPTEDFSLIGFGFLTAPEE